LMLLISFMTVWDKSEGQDSDCIFEIRPQAVSWKEIVQIWDYIGSHDHQHPFNTYTTTAPLPASPTHSSVSDNKPSAQNSWWQRTATKWSWSSGPWGSLSSPREPCITAF
jgi:hypothetical protein